MTRRHAPVRIGTSGWSYDHWQAVFYPEQLPATQRLEFYARQFRSVEINSSFYRLPARQTLQHWYDGTPADFRFSIKASRYITHMKKLGEPRKSVAPLLERIGTLADKLGPVLFQLPPRWHFNADRLEAFLASLSREFRYAFEFRDPNWLNEQTYALLANHNAAFCIYELDGFQTPRQVTSDFTYVRLHGPATAYQGSYDAETLADWAGHLAAQAAQGIGGYCYFDNDQYGYAVNNAATLQAMLR